MAANAAAATQVRVELGPGVAEPALIIFDLEARTQPGNQPGRSVTVIVTRPGSSLGVTVNFRASDSAERDSDGLCPCCDSPARGPMATWK